MELNTIADLDGLANKITDSLFKKFTDTTEGGEPHRIAFMVGGYRNERQSQSSGLNKYALSREISGILYNIYSENTKSTKPKEYRYFECDDERIQPGDQIRDTLGWVNIGENEWKVGMKSKEYPNLRFRTLRP